jgi:hypothetical protein
MIINYTEKSGILPMSVIIFFSKPKNASSTKSFDTSQTGVSDSLPESLPSPLDSQKPKASTHVGPPYPDIGILTEDELSKHETKVNLLKSNTPTDNNE